MSEENDGRLSFEEAVTFVQKRKQPVFSAMPVFGERTHDEAQTAEGARIFILEPASDGGWQLRFIAGPFFSNAYATDEVISSEETPDRVRELRFLPTRLDQDWFSMQIQVLIQKLVQNSGIAVQMPDYESMPSRSADPQTVFPVGFIGRSEGEAH